MKKLLYILFISGTLVTMSCKNANRTDDITTQEPDSGYKAMTGDSTLPDSIKDNKDRGAIAVDTLDAGRTTVSGASSDGSKK